MFHKVIQSTVAISMAIVDSHTRYRWMRSALWRTATVSFAHPASARAPQSTVLLIQRLPEPGEEPCRPVSFAPDPLRLHIDADLGRDGTDRLRLAVAVAAGGSGERLRGDLALGSCTDDCGGNAVPVGSTPMTWSTSSASDMPLLLLIQRTEFRRGGEAGL